VFFFEEGEDVSLEHGEEKEPKDPKCPKDPEENYVKDCT
jgi:hypothetical protein